MPEKITDRFIEALAKLESQREIEPMVALFSEDCDFGSAGGPSHAKGQEAVRGFWRMYLDTFREVRSEFTAVIGEGDQAALEWIAKGKDRYGNALHYGGVTMLRWRGDRIARFYAYFDPGVLAREKNEGVQGPVIFHREDEDLVREVP